MGNYIKYFSTTEEYTAFKNSQLFVTPNVSYVAATRTLYYTGLDNLTVVTEAEE